MKKILKGITASLLAIVCCVSAVACKKEKKREKSEEQTSQNVIKETDISLAYGGKTDYVIVLPDEASNYEQYAAEELSLYMGKSTNAAFAIKTEKEADVAYENAFDQTKKIISVGRTKTLENSKVKVDASVLKQDGYVVKTLGNVVLICGGAGYGTLYAVYEFLRLQIAWEPYAADEIYYRKNPNVKLLEFSVTDIPAIENRYGGWYAAHNDPYFAAKWRVYAGLGGMLFSENKFFDFHSLGKIMPPATYAGEHPDWYSANHAQPCFTSEGFKAELVENLKELFLKNPSLQFFPLGLEDVPDVSVPTMCTCDTCSADYQKYTKTGVVVRWANDIVARMLAWKEEAGIERELYFPVCAYYEIFNAPAKVNEKGEFVPVDESCVLNPNSPVVFCPIGASNEYPWTDMQYNSATKAELDAWLVCSKTFHLYCYTDNFFKSFEWTDSIATLVQQYRLGAELNAIYVNNDASNSTEWARAFQVLTGYVTSKLEWDPTLDTNELVENFITHYYREAAEEVLEYYYLMKTHVQIARDGVEIESKKTNRLGESTWVTSGLLDQSIGLLRKGIEKIKAAPHYTAAEKANYVKRMEIQLLTPLVYILDFCPDDYSANDYLAIVDEVEALTEKYGISAMEMKTSNEDKFKQWRSNKAV